MTRRLLAPAALALLLAACSGGSDEPAPAPNEAEAPIVENMGFENMVPPVAPDTNLTAPEPTPTPEQPPAVAPDEQVQEDADAVGMTARVDRSEANEAQPVEERKQEE
jgi:PBP1b-binding outer membrane lipoprotein LpoB